MQLTPREIDILTTIVEDFIATAAPVGSRTVAKKSRLRLSPASMRNIMADLTEKGLLEQPHTSAGRVPTAKAFRFYLDTELKVSPLAEAEQQVIKSYLGSSGLEITDMLRQASKILSSLCQQVSMVLAPQQSLVRWKRIEFALVKPGLSLVILILQGGIVQHKLIEVEDGVTSDDLVKYANYLNELFHGHTVLEVRALILGQLKTIREQLGDLRQRALAIAQEAVKPDPDREMFVDGTANILDQPEFSDMTSMRGLIRFLEERSKLLDILDKAMEADGIRITIGREAQVTDLSEMSLISSSYNLRGEALGVIGVIGPVRMDYAKVVPIVDFTAQILTDLLMKRF